jgi:hypothetical protein
VTAPADSRLYPLRSHPTQLAYATSPHRFNVVPAGRRSGKTERFKRKLRRKALTLEGITHNETPRFFAGAPTRDQAKRIFWADLKAMTRQFWAGTPSESELTIRLVNGSEIVVLGMDKPERIEGSPWDGGGLDEYANMKPGAWGENVRPALADRNGWCDLTGVPEGRNHYYERYTAAVASMLEHGSKSEWGAYTWLSADILPPAEIAAARRDLDALTFAQEYEASFVNFAGRIYHAFTDANKARLRDRYDVNAPLIFALDFNVSPGVACVLQSVRLSPTSEPITAVLGEVWIDDNSTTEIVCRKLLATWGKHAGRIEVYGDASGGARGTAQTAGSDWEIARRVLRAGDASQKLEGFGARVAFHVKPSNPSERARVNAVNTRLCSSDGTRRLFVDPSAAPRTVRDLEGVPAVRGGSGEIDKNADRSLTHMSDALGYYVDFRYPIADIVARRSQFTPF